MARLTFISLDNVPDLPRIPGDNGRQAILRVTGRNDSHGFWLPVEPEQDRLGPWDRMVQVVAGGGLLDFDVTLAQNHLIGAIFVGYRELTVDSDPARAALYARFTSKLRDVCTELLPTDDAEGRLRQVVEWLHDVLPENTFDAVLGYWKEEGPGAFGPGPGETTPDWIQQLHFNDDARKVFLRLEKASRLLATVPHGDELVQELAHKQNELVSRPVSRHRNPLDDVREMLAWVRRQVSEVRAMVGVAIVPWLRMSQDVYAEIMNV
ncbi:hypothetical protein OH76DRAFT_1415430 [Lentinus brumalis]|uniref:Uncharacterized protein n=1 Tax=Lentinus brumalis TaxID=2498619 RepID=A0A371DQB1_9APHY|nr:hypothetical protein OH76DRAFT_1415430 [Polyporus brumalis]